MIRAMKRWVRRSLARPLSPLLPGPDCVQVQCPRHLLWLIQVQGVHFFILEKKYRPFFFLKERSHRCVFSIWKMRTGLKVYSEQSAWQTFIPHPKIEKSFLGRAIARGNLYA